MSGYEKPVVLFGTGELSRRLRYYFEAWSGRRVVAMTLDADFLTNAEEDGVPIVAFEEVAERFSPEDHAFFSCIGYKDQNRGRARTFALAQRLGYEMASLISPTAIVNNASIGAGTIVCEGASLGPFADVGRGVVISSAAHVSHDTRVGDFCYLSSGSCIAGRCTIGSRTMVGLSAAIIEHITVPEGCLIGAGAVVVRSPTRPGVYVGNPARYCRSWE